MQSTPPTTPRKQSIKDFEVATPLTPRSASAHEIKTRLSISNTVTLSISHFTSLVTELTPSSPAPSLFSPLHNERTRLDRIEEFRMDFLCGAFMREKPPELQEDAFSDGARTSVGEVSTIASSVGDPAAEALPRSLIARGDLAERTIKARLKQDGVLIKHSNHKSFPAIAQRAMTKTLAFKKPIYCSCGLLRAPNFSKEYEEQGWAAPGIRWGNFKPDLVRFAAKGDEGEVTWEVVEIKYSASDKDIIYANYKIQAIYYHLALAKILSSVPNLVPSHKVSLWLSHDPLSPTYSEKPLAIRTTAAFAEHHLFVLLPQWLHIVTASEYSTYEARRKQLVTTSSASATNDLLQTPGLTFLERLLASSTPAASGSGTTPERPSSPLKQQVLPSVSPTTSGFAHLPPLPDEPDEDLADLLGGLEL